MSESEVKKKPLPTDRLVWIDMEMSGLDPDKDVVLEIATIITNNNLEIIAEGPDFVIHHPNSVFDQMDDWNKEHHGKSGLWKSVQESTISTKEAEDQTLAFLKKHLTPKSSPLCGNSIWQDRRFIIKHMKSIDEFLHYRLIDVSTIKELSNRWYGDSQSYKLKKNNHRALEDIKESIAELKHFRSAVFKP